MMHPNGTATVSEKCRAIIRNEIIPKFAVGAVFLAIRVDFVNKTITWRSFTGNNGWFGIQTSDPFPQLAAVPFECNITVERVDAKQSANGTEFDGSHAVAHIIWQPANITLHNITVADEKLPIWIVNWLQVCNGD